MGAHGVVLSVTQERANPVLQLYLFRNGRYWRSFYTDLRTEALIASVTSGEHCAFVFGPEEHEDHRLEQMERDIALRSLDLSAGLLLTVLVPRPTAFADHRRPELRLQGHLPWRGAAQSGSKSGVDTG